MHLQKNLTPNCGSGDRKQQPRPGSASTKLIEMADSDLLDLGRSRAIEQEVLDILDEPRTR